MNTKVYEPQPGTIPFNVIKWLRAQPAGASFSSAVIAEEVGVHTESLGPCMKPAIDSGHIVTERINGLKHWRLGNGTPPPASAPDADQDPVTSPAPEPTSGLGAELVLGWKAPAASATEPPAPPSEGTSAIELQPPPEPAATSLREVRSEDEVRSTIYRLGRDLPPTPIRPFRSALWSDGQLQIEKGGQSLVLNVQETRDLMRYLDRMAIEVPA